MNPNASDVFFNIDAYWFLFCKDELLVVKNEKKNRILSTYDIKRLANQPTNIQSIGLFRDLECFIGTISNDNIPEGFSFTKVRPLYGNIEDDCFWCACRAFHISTWLKSNTFCGCCKGVMKMSSIELALKCTDCGHLVYPRISPAIIVAVTKGDQLLLAHSGRFLPNRYGVIAGFVEPGETLEDCVKRELMEEVGVEVHKIKYFASQPWPFPDSLMVAFTAEALTKEITIDNQEILAAGWFYADNLPDISDKPSVGRSLIDWFIKTHPIK